MLFATQAMAQLTISGIVTDDKGNPLPNASVLIKGTTTGTVTRANGSYSLTLPANAKQLEFSYIGMVTQTVDINTSRSTYSITLIPEGKEMNAVVVVGILQIKKSQFAGAANKIAEKEIADKPVGSLDQLLQGRAPGVLALTGSGQPGNNSTILIRGTNSIVGGSAPLYVVDGVPVEAGVFQGLNPNDFASIDILRDAASLALYGSRGSAGVIVVTTKRGTGGKMRLSYFGQFGIKAAPDFAFRPMNSTEFLQAQKDYGTVLNNNSTFTGSATIPGWFYLQIIQDMPH
jgi:TonB-dependent SusC/RagA subfamily outer membrane receptor